MTNQTKTIETYRIWWSTTDMKGKPASSCAWDFDQNRWHTETDSCTSDYETALAVFEQEFELQKEKETPFKMTLAKEVSLFIYDKDDDWWIFDSSETTPFITKTHKD
jgi:hypothetical protein